MALHEVVPTLLHPDATHQEPRSVVRVVMLAPISVNTLEKYLHEGKNIEDVPIVDVVLGKKPDSGPSANRVIPFGGGIEPGEPIIEAALREASQESRLLALGTQRTIKIWDEQFKRGEIVPIQYKPPGRPTELLYMLTMPISSRDVQEYAVRGFEEDNMEDVVVMTPRDFKALIEHGNIEGSGHAGIVGSLSKTANDHIQISKDQRVIRNRVLDRITVEIDALEKEIRARTLKHINKIRYLKGEPLLERLSDYREDEIRRAYIGTQMDLEFEVEREREFEIGQAERKHAMKDGHDSEAYKELEHIHTIYPPPNQDGLKVAPYMSRESLLQNPELLISLPTRELVHKMNILRHSLIDTLHTVRFAEGSYRPFARLPWDRGLQHVLSSLHKRLAGLPPDVRAFALERLNSRMEIVFSKKVGVTKDQVHEAVVGGGDELFHEITMSLQRHIGGFQEHRSMNEIANAGLFQYVLLAMGIHSELLVPLNLEEESTRKLQFEALRELTLLFPEVEAIKEWNESGNTLTEVLLAEFFGMTLGKHDLLLHIDGKQVPHTLYHRITRFEINGEHPHIINDQRRKKGKESIVRKKLLEYKESTDKFAINLSYANDNYDHMLPLEERLHDAEVLRESMFSFFQQVLGPTWTVRAEWDSEDKLYKIARTYASLPQEKRMEYLRELVRKGGKRPGSEGYRIIRDQFRLIIEKGDKRYESEIDMYPLEDTHGPLTPDEVRDADTYWHTLHDSDGNPRQGVFAMGFEEKIGDDGAGPYSAARYYVRGSRYPTEPPLYELFWPSSFYNALITRIQKQQVVKKPKNWFGL